MAVDESVSLSDYAKHRGCSKQAVSKAVESGRLLRSIIRVDGKPRIADIGLADQEWERRVVRAPKAKLAASEPPAAAPAAQAPPPAEPPDAGRPLVAVDLFEAQRLSTLELARKRKLENDEREGRLVAVDKVAKEAFEAERTIRESVLNLPARIAGELAAETDTARIYALLDAALRQALSETADLLMQADHGGPDAAA